MVTARLGHPAMNNANIESIQIPASMGWVIYPNFDGILRKVVLQHFIPSRTRYISTENVYLYNYD